MISIVGVWLVEGKGAEGVREISEGSSSSGFVDSFQSGFESVEADGERIGGRGTPCVVVGGLLGGWGRVKFFTECFDCGINGGNRHLGCEAGIGSVVVVFISSQLGGMVDVIRRGSGSVGSHYIIVGVAAEVLEVTLLEEVQALVD